ncbi:recombination protein RecT [Amycolatopsis arida]|uniref:Recombination protein RecT n=1 Tax=Amycolatopsis arida TaxID=587909 RepID=A0A1I5KE35_9PSEU|nr:recombination protein RecT [Amycolatopsis arida]SFO83314.1 recombination protein RecT [Amycolatopsis arida]
MHGTALNPERFTRVALTVIRQSADLQRCRPESLLGALMTSAQLGLEPGPLGEAYLVPYGDQVTFIPGYRGLIKLAWQSGQLRHISARVVHEGDRFSYSYGLHPDLIHQPTRGDRGPITDVYAAATLIDGGVEFEVLDVATVETIRARSRAGRKGPWVTDWEAMARKTAIRQLAKWLPMATVMSRAIAAEGTVRTDLDADALDDLTADPGPEVLDADPAWDGPEPPGDQARNQEPTTQGDA